MLTVNMFQTLLASKSVTEEVQRQAYSYAKRMNNRDILVTLVRCPSLPEDLDEAISQEEDLAVLSAWANRADRTQDALLARFAKEKRATLLAGLAEAEDLPEELYRTLFKRKSVNLSWTLLQNSATSLELKVDAARFLGSGTTQTNYGVRNIVKPLTDADEAVALAFFEVNRNPAALMAALKQRNEAGNGSKAQTIAVARSLHAAATTEMARQAISSMVELLRDDQSNAFEEVLAEAKAMAVTMSSGEDSDEYYVRSLTGYVAQAEERRDFDVEAVLAPIRAAASASALEQAIQDAQRRIMDLGVYGRYDEEIANTAFGNPHLSTNIVSRHMRDASDTVIKQTVQAAIERNDAALVRWIFQTANWRQPGFDEFFVNAPDKAQFIAWLVDGLEVAPHWLVNSRHIGEDSDLALRYLPVANIAGNVRYAEAVQTTLLSALGDDPVKWELLTGLMADWNGSLLDLLDASVSLAE